MRKKSLSAIEQAKSEKLAQIERTSERVDKVHELAILENELFEVRQKLAEAGISNPPEAVDQFIDIRQQGIDGLRVDNLVQEDFEIQG